MPPLLFTLPSLPLTLPPLLLTLPPLLLTLAPLLLSDGRPMVCMARYDISTAPASTRRSLLNTGVDVGGVGTASLYVDLSRSKYRNLASLFSGFTTIISVHTTVLGSSITVLELYSLSLSQYSLILLWILANVNSETNVRLLY
jgi:hypothetical protein